MISGLLLGAALPALAQLSPLPSDQLCVTSGKIAAAGPALFEVNAGGMRAVAARESGDSAELRFTYRGPSADVRPLASGELRRQIGLKLRAQDSCNVVYIMWRVEPKQGVFVSVKRNPGMASHKECHEKGYINLKKAAAAPLVTTASSHALRASISGGELTVSADGRAVWSGPLPSEAFAFNGPPGVRSDNGDFIFELSIQPGSRAVCQKQD